MGRDPRDGRRPAWQPLLQLPLRACLLSGGESRRMGRDKALLPHHAGSTWLELSLRLLAQLEMPITLISRHSAHLELAEEIALKLARRSPVSVLAEPPPWEGPLLALHRLMQQHPDERLLLCPVDMPDLSLAALQTLLAAAADDASATAENPTWLHLAHDGERLQPLLGVYPSSAPIRCHLASAVERGERRLQSWLVELPYQAVTLDPRVIRNVNRPEADKRI
ncbi:molybdenum cofactor guanylyltransferase [Cyanobium sp. WAJ14-Wanaka]|nr:molybdenum cofactor guanylyltransferase [Cyanobium sp. WAJ14-Wanaka]